ncbi:unnamed protein product, partial [Mesorhabditis belari]|uniref:Methyltransferase type 11 domain-containing protein n=1 Tax=Mesorhabditis belari TaxID=2138241 RepID=A0AAF3FEV2_9BILA
MKSVEKSFEAHDFTSPEFWKKFFAERGTPFEWYGGYDDLSVIIEQYVTPKNCVLQIGCGNSELATEMYDNGFHQIHSIDTNAKVIKQQSTKNRNRSGLAFSVDDATKLTLADLTFDVVLDKGTLDAMFPPKATDEQKEMVSKMFSEVARVLKPLGRYLIVTLAQEHILDFWLKELSGRFILKVHKVKNSTRGLRMPVFVLVATKLLKPLTMTRPIDFVNSNDTSVTPISSLDELFEVVKAEQQMSSLLHYLAQPLKEETSLKLWGSDKQEKYQVYIVDKEGVAVKLKSYGVFIVPYGRKHEFLYADPKGRKELRSNCKKDRLAIVHVLDKLMQDFIEIQDDLNPYALQWAPAGKHVEHRHQFLTVGDDNTVEVLETGNSEVNGEFVVKDVEIEGEFRRQLVFLASKNLIQSEVLLKVDEGRKFPMLNHLTSEHHEVMLIALGLHESKPLESLDTADLQLGILGLGGGLLASYLLLHLPKCKIIGIELDPEVVRIAESYFALPTKDPRLEVRVVDALDYLQVNAHDDSRRQRLDILFVDVAGGEATGITCPPPSFLTDQALDNMKRSLKPNGILALNFVTRDQSLAGKTRGIVQKHFKGLYSMSVAHHVNEILIASAEELDIVELQKTIKRDYPLPKMISQRLGNMKLV